MDPTGRVNPPGAEARPMSARAVALAVVALVAGCTSGLGPTPTPGPPAERVVAPGINESGISDIQALLSAHRATLEDRSYTLETRLTLRNASGGVRGRQHTTMRVDAAHDRVAIEQSGSGLFAPSASVQPLVSAYSTETATYARLVLGGDEAEVVYFRYPSDRWGDSSLFRDFPVSIGSYLSRPERVTVERTSVDGWIAYRLESVDDESAVSVELVVDSFGFVHSMAVTVPATHTIYGSFIDGTVTYALAYRAVGQTRLTRPAWLAEAIARTGDGPRPNASVRADPTAGVG